MIHLTLPVPNETPQVWETFKSFVERYLHTLASIDPGEDYLLHPVYTDEWTEELGRLFLPFKYVPMHYPEQGWDIGAAQWMAHRLPPGDQVVSFSTRSYFHRDGWLRELAKAREKFGRGLYGTSASNQYRPHVCVRSYMLDVSDFQAYPWTINSRTLGPCFETGVPYTHPTVGKGVRSISEFISGLGLPVKVVRFDGVFDFKPSILQPNGFRSGDQRELLIFDRHSLIYAESDERYKRYLEGVTKGPSQNNYPDYV